MRLLLGAALAALLLTGATGAAGGSYPPPPPGSGFPETKPKPGQTIVGVQTADKTPENLSISVPLYLTVAATRDSNNTPQVVAPDGYVLRNTTQSVSDGSIPDIAVTGVEVQSVPDGTWSLTTQTPTGNEQIKLTIGGLTLPEVAAGTPNPVPADMLAATSSFYDKESGKFMPIRGGEPARGMNLPIEGELPSDYQPTEERAAAQFRIKYTVSMLDASGKPIGVYYEGPGKDDALNPEPSPSPAGP